MEWQEVILRLISAACAGGLVGFEREWHGRAAGLRTHILVCLGATLFMMVSIGIGMNYSAVGSVDFARIAAGVVTGIGFLGAGAIIRYGDSVRGLTTAASIWSVSAVGLAIGLGMYFPAFSATVIIVAILALSRFEENLAWRRHGEELVIVAAHPDQLNTRVMMEKVLECGAKIKKITREDYPTKKQFFLILDISMDKDNRENIFEIFKDMCGVDEVYWR